MSGQNTTKVHVIISLSSYLLKNLKALLMHELSCSKQHFNKAFCISVIEEKHYDMFLCQFYNFVDKPDNNYVPFFKLLL